MPIVTVKNSPWPRGCARPSVALTVTVAVTARTPVGRSVLRPRNLDFVNGRLDVLAHAVLMLLAVAVVVVVVKVTVTVATVVSHLAVALLRDRHGDGVCRRCGSLIILIFARSDGVGGLFAVHWSLLSQAPGPKRERRTGRRMSPCRAPNTMTRKTILKKVMKM